MSNREETFLQWAAEIGATVYEYRLPDGLCGVYCERQHSIILDDRLSPVQYRCTLVHELVHAQHRDNLSADSGFCERRARRETARKLISRQAFEQAACTYEDNPFLMCADLDVTLRVLEDYKTFIHAGGSHGSGY